MPIEENVVQARPLVEYDKEKYREMILDEAETVLGIFRFDRTVYGNFEKIKKGRRRRKWYEELREEIMKDIQTEMS